MLNPTISPFFRRLSPAQESSSVAEEAAAVEPTPTSTCYSLQPQQSQARQSNVTDSEKWPCKVCTYLNWPRSLRCVQCCTKRGGEAIERGNDKNNEADADRAGEALQALRISGSDTELGQPAQLIGATASNRLSLSPGIDDATHLNNLANASHNQSQSQSQIHQPAHQQQMQLQLQQHHTPQQRESSSSATDPPQQKPCYVAKWACNVGLVRLCVFHLALLNAFLAVVHLRELAEEHQVLHVRQDEGAGDQWIAERLARLLQSEYPRGAPATATAKRGHRQCQQLVQ